MILVLVAIVIVASPRGKDEEAKGRRKGGVRATVLRNIIVIALFNSCC